MMVASKPAMGKGKKAAAAGALAKGSFFAKKNDGKKPFVPFFAKKKVAAGALRKACKK